MIGIAYVNIEWYDARQLWFYRSGRNHERGVKLLLFVDPSVEFNFVEMKSMQMTQSDLIQHAWIDCCLGSYPSNVHFHMRYGQCQKRMVEIQKRIAEIRRHIS